MSACKHARPRKRNLSSTIICMYVVMLCVLMQTMYRAYVARRDYQAMRAAAVTVQAMWRGREARRELLRRRAERAQSELLRKQNAAAQVVQAHWRGYMARKEMERLRNEAPVAASVVCDQVRVACTHTHTHRHTHTHTHTHCHSLHTHTHAHPHAHRHTHTHTHTCNCIHGCLVHTHKPYGASHAACL